MIGIIIVIIFIVAFSLKAAQGKNGRSKGNSDHNRTAASGSAASERQIFYGSGNRQSERNISGRTNGSSVMKAQYVNNEKFVSQKTTKENFEDIRMAAGIDEDDGAILSAAKINTYMTEMDNELDSQEDLMKAIYDLMITGPDTSIPSGRDFVAEAIDMLNGFHIKRDENKVS